jgi:uncharacterized sulfatase
VGLVIMATALLAGRQPLAAAQRPEKLNVLFIAVDDLNCRLGCYGDPVVKTPHIDKLAARGMRFERAYCNYPLCNPSRTSLLSGRRPETTRVVDNQTPPRTTLGKDVVFLPEYFRQHGYVTARIGKISHNIYEDSIRWDVSEHPRGPKGEDLHRQAYVGDAPPGRGASAGNPIIGIATDRADADEPDGRIALRAVELLEQSKDKPFFIAVGFYRPHGPWVCPKQYFDLYPPDKIQLPKEPADHLKQVPPIALLRFPADEKMTDAEKRQAVAAYHACTSFVDAQIGVVLDALQRLKLADRTVVVLFGDHGFLLGEHGLWRKFHLFEESDRVPLILRVPGRNSGVSPRLAELVDLYPTLAELVGLPAPKGVEGTSLAPLLDDPKRPWKNAAFISTGRKFDAGIPAQLGRAVRTERYRYTDWGKDGAELYDHDSDPKEYANLAKDSKHAATVAEMKKLLEGGWKGAVPPRR